MTLGILYYTQVNHCGRYGGGTPRLLKGPGLAAWENTTRIIITHYARLLPEVILCTTLVMTST